jgi:MFS transporter, DHA2 family, multidrug resistance protein
VLTALAPTFWMLVVGRVLQGLASAMYLAVYMPIVADAVREDQRGRAMSYIQMIMMIGSITVAPIGGLVATEFGWRAVFLFTLPILVVVLWWEYRAVPERRMAGRRLPPPRLSLVKDALVLGGTVALGLLAIEWVEESWSLAAALATAAVAAGLLWWRLPTARPVVALVRHAVFGAAATAFALVTSISGIVIFSLPFFISDVMGRPPAILGVGMVFFVGAAALLSPAAGFLADRFGALTVAMVGALLTTLAMLNMLCLGSDTGLVDLAWRMAALGAAMGMFNAPVMTTLLSAAPEGEEGAAGGVANLARTLGNTLGTAIAALTWALIGGGAAGFHAGVLVLTTCTVSAFVALLIVRRRKLAHEVSNLSWEQP